MTRTQANILALLRIAMGMFLLYAGVVKVINPAWSAAGYLKGAKTFSGFYQSLTDPNILPIINFLNEWGLVVLGIALIVGIGVRLAGMAGAGLMILYYFPVLDFPYIAPYSFIVDEHIIYALALLVLASFRAGRTWGLERWCASLPICARYPRLRALIG